MTAYLNTLLWLQICVRWGIQHGTSVIPKATSKDHILGNLDVLDWELKPEDYEVMLAPARPFQSPNVHLAGGEQSQNAVYQEGLGSC